MSPVPTLTSITCGGPCGIARQQGMLLPLLPADQINPIFPKQQPDIQWALPANHCYKFVTP